MNTIGWVTAFVLHEAIDGFLHFVWQGEAVVFGRLTYVGTDDCGGGPMDIGQRQICPTSAAESDDASERDIPIAAFRTIERASRLHRPPVLGCLAAMAISNQPRPPGNTFNDSVTRSMWEQASEMLDGAKLACWRVAHKH